MARHFVSELLGAPFAEPIITDLEIAAQQDSDSGTPLVCFLSMGSDPTENIERLAKRLGLSKIGKIGKTIFVIDIFYNNIPLVTLTSNGSCGNSSRLPRGRPEFESRSSKIQTQRYTINKHVNLHDRRPLC